jgi:hypothetical protein
VTDEVALVERLGRDAGRLDPSDPASAEDINEVLEFVVPVIEHALLARGWRLKHPAVRGVLVGPAGTLVDRDRLVDAYNDPALVRGWLSERVTPTTTGGAV